MNKLFSIVIPVYNRAAIVKRTLDSIHRQSYRPIHLILVDNNSSDESLSVLENWKRAHETKELKVSITSEITPGAAAARNKGFEMAKSEYIAFFDSDDVMRQDCINTYMATFEQHPDAKIVCSNSLYHFINGNTRLFKFRKGNILHNHIYHATLRTQGYAVRTDYLRKCKMWNTKALVWNDWELGIRLLLGNPKVISTGKVLSDIYMQEQSITGTRFIHKAGMWEEALDLADECICNSVRKDTDTLHRLIDYRRVVLAAQYLREGNKKLASGLFNQVMQKNCNDMRMRILMPIVFGYVSRGGRGAALFVDPLL